MTREQLNNLLRRNRGSKSLRTYASDLGVSAAYLSDVLRGRRDPGKKILDPLRLRAVKTTEIEYERK